MSSIPPMVENEKTDGPAAFLLRDIPREVMDKMRAAAAIHKRPLKAYILELFAEHIKELERKGLILSHEAKRRKH